MDGQCQGLPLGLVLLGPHEVRGGQLPSSGALQHPTAVRAGSTLLISCLWWTPGRRFPLNEGLAGRAVAGRLRQSEDSCTKVTPLPRRTVSDD